MNASILQQLLALYFAIIYSWQLSCSEKSLVGKKNSSIYLKDFTDVDFFFFIFLHLFFHFLWQMPVYLVSYAKRMLYSEEPTVLLARRHLNTMIFTNFENLNSISNIFQETHDFLVLSSHKISGKYNVQKVFYKNAVLKNFVIFIGKHLRWNLFFNKNAGLQTCSLIKKRLQHRWFLANIDKFLRTPILKNYCERLLLRVSLERFPTWTNNIGSEENVFSKRKPNKPF